MPSADLRPGCSAGIFLGDANLSGAFFGKADLSDADLSDANLTNTDLDLADLSGVKLHRAFMFGSVNLCAARSLHGVTGLDAGDMKEIQEQCPHLLEAPKGKG